MARLVSLSLAALAGLAVGFLLGNGSAPLHS
jgi:hypothetical protein